jgi:NAD(P)-dependent dehydrogenase (short-subunit alcohol dehydrogenase family)
MRTVSIITGGGSGMGLATAKMLGKEHYIIIAGRNRNKLEKAINELREVNIESEFLVCDISNRASVDALAKRAREIGVIHSVIHAAGMSPSMGDAAVIMHTNAVGTININEAFFDVMESGSCIIDVSSMSGYLVPGFFMPKRIYKYSRTNKDLFIRKMMARVNLFPKRLRSAMAYAFSKNFVMWYAKTDAVKFGEKGIRVLSVSPGSFETPMGELEKDSMEKYTRRSAIKRSGRVDEIANLFAFCVSSKASYLTGIDILCDGGCIASGVNPLRTK